VLPHLPGKFQNPVGRILKHDVFGLLVNHAQDDAIALRIHREAQLSVVGGEFRLIAGMDRRPGTALIVVDFLGLYQQLGLVRKPVT